MVIVRSFLSELFKIRRSLVMWMCILGALVIPVVFTLRNVMVGFSINDMVRPDAWMIQYWISLKS